MGRDYIPRRDADLMIWADNFYNLVFKHQSLLGISAPEVTQLLTLQALFSNTMTLLGQDRGSSARVLAKNKARRDLVALVRLIVNRYIRFNGKITDQLRHEMGLNFPHNLPPTPSPVPTTSPAWRVGLTQACRLTIAFGRESDVHGGVGSIRIGRPRGVAFCEIAYVVKAPGAAAPNHHDDYHICVTETRSPFVLDFDLNQRGHTVFFILRWVNTTSQAGPWSAPGEAIIP